MGDDEARAALQRGGQRLLHERLVLGVEVAGGLVEDDDGRVLQEHAGDGQALLLAAREAVAALADERVEPVGQRGDHVVDPRGPAGGRSSASVASGRA